jgi:hypothetical protein
MKRPTLILYIVLCFTAGLAVGCAMLEPVDGNPATTQPSTQPYEANGPNLLDPDDTSWDFIAMLLATSFLGAAGIPVGKAGLTAVRAFLHARQKKTS